MMLTRYSSVSWYGEEYCRKVDDRTAIEESVSYRGDGREIIEETR